MVRYPTRRAVSAGGLVIDDRPGGRWVLLIARRNQAGALQWSLPKGGLESGEDHATAAVREVSEETGLQCAITGELGVIDYWFVWRDDGVRYHKYVHYFTIRPESGSLGARDDEADDIAWLPVDEALDRLSHDNEREIVARVAHQARPAR